MEEITEKWWKARTANIVAVLSIVCLFALIVLWTFIPIPPANKDLLSYITLQITTLLLGAIAWFLFGFKKHEDAEVDTNSNVTTQTMQLTETKINPPNIVK